MPPTGFGSDDELRKAIKLYNEQAKLVAQISSSYADYVKAIRDAGEVQKTIKETEKEINDLIAKGGANLQNLTDEEYKRLQILEKQTDNLKKQNDQLKEAIKQVNGLKVTTGKMVASTIKGLAALPGFLAQSFGKLKGYGLFEMDKAVKMSALQMGLLGKEGAAYANSIRETAVSTNDIGVNIEALAKIQGQYVEDLGRTVMLSDKGLKSMAAMSVATGLGADGAGDLAVNMEEIGLSAERTGDYITQTMNDSHKMGLNASKVVKNIQGNIKMLNKYHFKDGIKGLAKMAELSSKLGIKMDFAASMADKMWDIEGAVDMSAQLQVMGGAWAKLSDPFHLMFMARNDMKGLTEEIANASQASMHLAKDGSIQMSSQEMSRLKIIAQQTGLEYDDLVKSGKELFKMNKVKQQINFGFTEDQKEFIANTAQIGKDGKATVEIKGDTKLVSQLSKSDQSWLQMQVGEKKSMEQRAKASQNFDDKLTNLIGMVKTFMLPIIDGINETLGPIVDDFMKDTSLKNSLRDFGKDLRDMVVATKPFFQTVGSIIKTLGPTGTLAVLFGGKVLFNLAQWISNGVALGKGFLATAGGPTGIGKGLGGLTKGIAKLGGYISLAGSVISLGMDAIKNAKDPSMSGWDAFKKTIWDNKGKIIGGIVGGVAGALTTGGAGTVVGAGYGSQIGGMFDEPSNDALFGSPMHDGVAKGKKSTDLSSLIGNQYGKDFSKGRGILQGGKIHPIDNKDDLLAMKKGGPVDKANKKANIPDTIHHTFDAIKIEGSLMLNIPGQPGQDVDLLKNSQFIRDITSLIHVETKRQINQKQ